MTATPAAEVATAKVVMPDWALKLPEYVGTKVVRAGRVVHVSPPDAGDPSVLFGVDVGGSTYHFCIGR